MIQITKKKDKLRRHFCQLHLHFDSVTLNFNLQISDKILKLYFANEASDRRTQALLSIIAKALN